MHDPTTARDGHNASAAGARSRQPERDWVPVGQMPALARALLHDELTAADEVPARVADRVTTEAQQWREAGCDELTVRRWKRAGVPPAAAGYLASRDVAPDLLALPVDTVTGVATDTLSTAVTAGRISVERAYDLLVATGLHTQRAASSARAAVPRADALRVAVSEASAQPAGPRRPVAPVTFSHPTPGWDGRAPHQPVA